MRETDTPARNIGPYRIERKLGEGGMGAVYLAVHETLDRNAAIKVLPDAMVRDNAEFVKRFFIEARAAARLDHPNLVRVYDAGEQGGIHFIAMEYVDGMDLRSMLARQKRIPEAQALEIARQACLGLEAAAMQSIIHRDIKPANIMVTPQGLVKIADFGLAKNTDADAKITKSGQVMGTPAYISPEQALGEKADFRSDIYSLGATLFEMLTGETPFKSETVMGLLRQHCKSPAPDPRSIHAGIGEAAARLVLRMLAKSPAERFGSHAELRDCMEKAMSGGAVPQAAQGAGVVSDELSTLYVEMAKRPQPGAIRKAGFFTDIAAPPKPDAQARDSNQTPHMQPVPVPQQPRPAPARMLPKQLVRTEQVRPGFQIRKKHVIALALAVIAATVVFFLARGAKSLSNEMAYEDAMNEGMMAARHAAPDWARAVAAFKKALELKPESKEARDKLEEAVKAQEALLNSGPPPQMPHPPRSRRWR